MSEPGVAESVGYKRYRAAKREVLRERIQNEARARGLLQVPGDRTVWLQGSTIQTARTRMYPCARLLGVSLRFKTKAEAKAALVCLKRSVALRRRLVQ